jgi:L-lysine exporter family protein LysE/ArgO
MGRDFWTGFATGLALIVAIGSQNVFVLRQGIRREHVLAIVLFCAVSDAVLILAGIGGAGALIQGNPALVKIARFGGAAFLAAYGLLAARRAWRGVSQMPGDKGSVSLARALTACFAFTFLNPHVYLDTVVLLGSVSQQRLAPWVFGWGACLSSLVWFSALGFGARLLAPWFESARAWRILDTLIALVMGTLAAMLVAG